MIHSKDKLLVSVIMPAYNASNYIHEAINSVIAQTYTNWELIIVDDGSTDKTATVIETYLLLDQRISYYYQENAKQGKARNLAISKSKGEYIAFLDADDVWVPEKLEIQIQEIQDMNVDLVFASSYLFKNNEIQDQSKKLSVSNAFFKGGEAIELFLQSNRIPILTVLVKRKKLLSVNAFSEKLSIQNAEDYHLWLKMLLSGCVFYSSDKVLAAYRLHNESVLHQTKIAKIEHPEVLYDLMQLYPVYHNKIRNELKLKFIFIYRNNLFSKAELKLLIVKNSLYLSKSIVRYFYLFLNLFLPTKITRRALIYILNG